MEDRSYRHSSEITGTDTSSNDVRLKVIEVAGGDLHFAETLRRMIWQEYCEAGQPFGSSEEAMFLWMEHKLRVEDED